MNKIIGVVGEDPNDTSSLINLLKQRFDENVTYITLINNIRGHQLDNERTKIALEIAVEKKKPNYVVFVRDADGLATHNHKIEKCQRWYQNISSNIQCEKTFLLNIWELEALIFADINTFNKEYKTSIKGGVDVTFIQDPKRELKNKTYKLQKKYSESDCPDLFKKIDVNVVIKNCSFFRNFYNEFSEFFKKKKK